LSTVYSVSLADNRTGNLPLFLHGDPVLYLSYPLHDYPCWEPSICYLISKIRYQKLEYSKISANLLIKISRILGKDQLSNYPVLNVSKIASLNLNARIADH